MKGINYIQGHVEIKYNGIWGTICDDLFDRNNNGAMVLCRMMGHRIGQYSTEYRQSNVTKASKIWLDDVKCQGNETNIDNCQREPWGNGNCEHHEDVAIRCTNYTGKYQYLCSSY